MRHMAQPLSRVSNITIFELPTKHYGFRESNITLKIQGIHIEKRKRSPFSLLGFHKVEREFLHMRLAFSVALEFSL